MGKKAMATQKLIRSVIDTYTDFAENTSIHGVKYTVSKKTSIFEKIFWVLIVALGVWASIYMIGLFWDRYNSNPTRTSIQSAYASTTAIPFPAITICNLNTILDSKVKGLVNKLNLKGFDKDYVITIFSQLLAYSENHNYNISDLNVLQNILYINDLRNVASVMRLISQNCREMLLKCKWETKIIDCHKYFEDVFTSSGICCSFNYKPSDDIETSTLYFGYQMGLTVLLDPMVQEVNHFSIKPSGAKVIIHNTRNYPGFGNTEKVIASGRETLLQLDGLRYICSKDVRKLIPAQRKCVYSDEYDLQYFSKYTEPNCVSECLSKQVEETCHCRPYYYTYSDRPVCNVSKIPCLAETRNNKNGLLQNGIHCDCPMQCEDVFYEVLSTSTKFEKTEYLVSSFFTKSNKGAYRDGVETTENSMLLHVYFSKQTQTVMLRDTITSTIYLLSSLGGVFSLFLGCSFISGAEIIYYICVRFPINLRRSNQIQPKLFKPKMRANLNYKTNLRFHQVSHADLKGSNLYIIYDKNAFLN